ncbi:MAG TPA: MraY family glycosyltransferase [bacterium]|nr:MraY family glycosyltransferase [bacterium]
MSYIFLIVAVLALSVLAVKFYQWLAWRWQILDYPRSARKIHTEPVPLTGGLAIATVFLLAVVALYYFDYFKFVDFSLANLVAISVAIVILMAGGTLDDRYNLSPKWQIITPFLAIAVIVFGGIGVDFLTNPFNGSLIYLSAWMGNILAFVWLMGMMYTTKLLDGLDGLVGGMAFIGSAVIALLILNMSWLQSDVLYLVLAFMAALLGFLIFNLPKASIFLGEGGSLLAGFMLGVFSILAGSKIATTLLVMALPIIDTAWVIGYRLYQKKPIFFADKNHLHHRLLALGWRPYQILVLIYLISFLFGLSTLLLNPLFKMIILLCLISALLVFEYYLTIKILKQERL